jgi:hypothetical protein
MYGHVKVEVCPRCREKLYRVDRFKEPAPFWTRLPGIFRYPLEDDGWMRILAIGLAAVVLQGLGYLGLVLGGFLGLLAAISLFTFYYGIVFSYFYLVISESETGKLKPPEWGSYSSLTDFRRPVTQFMATCLVVFMPALLFFFLLLGSSGFDIAELGQWMKSPGIIILFLILGLLGLAILPMGLLLLGVFGTARMAWNPVTIFGQIMKIPKEYTALLGFLILFILVAVIVRVAFFFIKAALGGGFIAVILRLFIDNAVEFYFLVAFGHILGYTAYQCQYKLGWWKETREVKEAMKAPVQAIHPNLEEGLALVSQGAFNRAADLLEVVLQDEPNNRIALRGMLSVYCGQKKEDKAREVAQRLFAYYLQDNDQEGTATAYQEMVAAFPKFVLPGRQQIIIAKWLRGQKKFMEAAAAYRQYAVAYPDDSMSAKALYQCGVLLWKQCSQPDNARRIFEYILKRYPQSDLIQFIRDALKELPGNTPA